MENTKTYEWYDARGNIAPREDITEVNVVGNHTPTGNEIEWRYVSSEGEHIATAYANGTNLTLVLKDLTIIPARMFHKFLSLENVYGLEFVTTIGESAFCYTPKITKINIDPTKLASIGQLAFRMSSAEDALKNLKDIPENCIVDDKATRHKRWGEDGLQSIKSFWESQTGSLQKVFLDVPNIESQYKYDKLMYCTINGVPASVAATGCAAVNLYHVWNTIYAGTSKEYGSFSDWFAATLNNGHIYPMPQENVDLTEQVAALGWALSSNVNERLGYIKSSNVNERLGYIVNSLANGLPVSVRTNSPNIIGGYHSCAIVGYDVASKKLAITDSAVLDSRGVISWIAFEDIFSGGHDATGNADVDGIYLIDFKHPTLAPGCSWFAPPIGTSIKRADITEIVIQTEPYSGSATASWAASAKGDTSVMAYVNEEKKLILAGNGDVAIWANPDSSFLFSDSATTGADKFSKLVTIRGAELLKTNKARTFRNMFNQATQLQSVDVSSWDTHNVEDMYGVFNQAKVLQEANVTNWDTSSCTDMGAMFQCALTLTSLDLSKWDVSKVTNMFAMLQGHQTIGDMSLTTIGDVSKWDTSSVTNMRMLFNRCPKLTDVDVRNWDVSNVEKMGYMFYMCETMRELDLSKWNVANVADVEEMLNNMLNLEKLSVNSTFSFTDSAGKSCNIAAPSSTYIPLADGNWYDIDGNAYAPANLAKNPTRVYYASKFIIAGEDDQIVFVKNGTLRQIAMALRSKSGKGDTMRPSEFAEEVLAL